MTCNLYLVPKLIGSLINIYHRFLLLILCQLAFLCVHYEINYLELNLFHGLTNCPISRIINQSVETKKNGYCNIRF